MKRLVIDIETVGALWEDLDPYVREYLIKGMSEGEAEEAKRSGGLSPFRGRIVAIGVINPDTGRSCALYEIPGQSELVTRREGLRTLISGSEKLILEKFWELLGRDDRFISFNGRQFDGPFLMIRSAINGVIPKRDLVGYRYRFHPNCDLRDVLSFWGTVNGRQFKFNLDLACKAFGIATSKSDGMDGRAVESMYRAGRYEAIATYCLEDVRATSELYLKLVPTLLVWEQSFRDSEARSLRRLTGTSELTSQPDEAITPEQTFLDSIAESSLQLSNSLEEEAIFQPSHLATERHGASILEKLAGPKRDEEAEAEAEAV
ncbi:MAG TPA: ribonuclease H-like domain-containing protein [Thermoanaerobaculia bacterium]|nr:ribonuclease H-like domain-containing protein [Thermoanaerobaculia bacterium]